MEQTVKRLKVIIKFSLNKHNELVGFITKDGSSWKGCYENDPRPHKLVLVDRSIQAGITPGYIYKCILVPMKRSNGYVCVEASIITHNAYLEITPGHQVIVHNGNRTIIYDPKNGSTRNTRSREAALRALSVRRDISNLEEIISDFIDACNEIDKLI